MLRLTTLGAIRFTGLADSASPHPILSQPKRLALLAYLALARQGSLVFRDTLLALLWPDYATLQARRALRQTLHHLRLELGADVIIGSHSAGVGLDPDCFWCDAAELERACAAQRFECALDLYGGEFLPGFHPQCGAAYQHWLDTVRDRLRRRVTLAAATLAERAELNGDARAALEYARRGVELLPCDEPAARLLIRLLAQAGNRSAALAAYEALGTRLHGQLGLSPDTRSRALAAAVRDGRQDDLDATLDGEPNARSPQPLEARLPSLAVLPFATLSGSPGERVLAEGVGEMLITELTRRGCVSVISRTSVQPFRDSSHGLATLARNLGVELVVEGTVLECGDRQRITVQLLVASPEHHLWAGCFEPEPADPLSLQAALAATVADHIEAAIITSRQPAAAISAET